MSWGDPAWLWGLPGIGLVALALLVLALFRRGERAVRWPRIRRVAAAGARLRPVPAGRGVRRPWLLLLATTAVVLALARPRWGEIEEPVFQQAREVMLALDLSRSMLVQDVPPSRLDRARLLLQNLLDGLGGERVGLIVFAGTAFVQVPLSADYQILNEFLPELKPDYMPQGGTDYTGMLRAAMGGFSEMAHTDRFLIVLSDGESTTEGWREQIDALRKQHIRVIALGVGTSTGGFIPDPQTGFAKDARGAVVMSKLEPTTLQTLARETGGAYRDASTWVDLSALLAETVARGREGEFTERRNARQIERFQWVLLPAIVLALLGLWREIAVRPRAREVRRSEATPRPPSATRSRPARPAGAAATLALMLFAAFLALAPPAHATVKSTPATPVDAVRETITRLAAAPERTVATDWRELAERTIEYGNTTRAAGQPIEPGAIRDALTAVDLGERSDPAAADWAHLREALQKFIDEPPPQSPPPQEQQQQQNQNESQNEQSQQNQQQQSDSQNNQQDQQQSSSSDQPQQEQKQPPPDQSQQQPAGSEQKNSPPPEKQPAENATPQGGELGEMKEQPPPETPPPTANTESAPKTRKVGGRPPKDSNETPPNPETAAALQHLRQVTERDSPARLFDLLEGEATEPAAKGPDW